MDHDCNPVKKKHDLLNDPLFTDSGIMLPVHHPVKYHSFLKTVSEVSNKANSEQINDFPCLYMTATTYIFQLPLDPTLDRYISYASHTTISTQFLLTKKLKKIYL